MADWRRVLIRKLTIVTLAKLAAILLLFILFFGPDRRVDTPSTAVERHLYGGR